MKLSRSIEDIPFDKKSVVTIGTYDGVHLAHQKIIGRTVELAREISGRSIVVTFDPHPREVLDEKNELRLLTTLQERQEICENLGIDWFLVIEFNKDFAQQNFREFYIKYLVNGIGISLIVEGFDHHWGKNREGNINALIELGKEYGFDVVSIEQYKHNDIPVNSSVIRNELTNGMVDTAAELLGRHYSLFGKVIQGDKRGRTLGYPTANIDLSSSKKVIPKDGIYFVQVLIDGKRYFGIASIGIRPTFHTDGKRIFEVFILDYNKDIYGQNLQVNFLQRLRDEKKFETAPELIQKMKQDEELSRKLQVKYKELA